MKRPKALFLSVAAGALTGATLLAGASGAFAQGAPPDLPSTFYGPIVSGGPQAGDPVVAFVISSGITRSCGAGIVLNDNGLKYTIDVFADDGAAYDNCGDDGRTVRFYFPKTRQFASQTGTWQQGLALEVEANPSVGLSLSMGTTLSNTNRLTGIAAR